MTQAIIPVSEMDLTFEVMVRIGNERLRQDRKWGVQDHDLSWWATILGEEYGEFCHEVLEERFGGGEHTQELVDEVIQVAAVATAIVEYLLRHRGDRIKPDIIVPCPHCGGELYEQVVMEDGLPKCGVCWKVVSTYAASDVTSAINMPGLPAPEMEEEDGCNA